MTYKILYTFTLCCLMSLSLQAQLTINCNPATLHLDASCLATISTSSIATASGGTAPYTFSPASVTYTNAHIGANNLSIIVTDAVGATASGNSVVTVADVMPPAAFCQSFVAYLNAGGTAIVNASQINSASYDNCSSITLLINGGATLSYNCAHAGTNNTAVLEATDISGNTVTCTASISVVDTVSPVAQCQNRTVFLNASGIAVVAATQIDNVSYDNCSIVSYTINGGVSQTYTCANVGTNAATLQVTDASGNSSTCTATITVVDTVRPTAICRSTPLTVTLSSGASGSATVNAIALNGSPSGSNDACGVAAFLINGVPAYTYHCNETGANIATLTVRDASGNSSSCVTTVTVNDVTLPIARCRNITTYIGASGTVRVPARTVDNTTTPSTDNCGIVSWTIGGQDTLTYNCANTGNNVVTLSIRDASNNVATCNAIITVMDTTPPIAQCQNLTIFLNAGGTANVSAAQIDAGSYDNCSVNSRLINGAVSQVYTCANIGTNPAILQITDASGNSSTCTATITVIDTSGATPTAQCQNATITLSSVNGTATIPASAINTTCGAIDTMTVSPSIVSCANIGVITVILTVTDVNGVSTTCPASVTVQDVAAPIMLCRPDTAYLDASGMAPEFPADIDNGSFDPCGLSSLTISRLLTSGASTVTYSCVDLGNNPVILIATDVYGNIGSCTTTVRVMDTLRPIAQCQNLTVFLNSSGAASINASQIDNTSSDNCGTGSLSYAINGASSQTYTCANVGINTAILQITDASGNTSTCASTITVMDTTPPTMTCPPTPINLYLTNGSLVINQALLNTLTFPLDNCGNVTATFNGQSSLTFNCSQVGSTQTINVTLMDAWGNSSNCIMMANILDTTTFAANCHDTTLILHTTVPTSIYAQDLVAVSGGCAPYTYSIDGQAFLNYNCTSPYLDTVELMVVDASGQTATCSSIVTVTSILGSPLPCINSPMLSGYTYLDTNGDCQYTAGTDSIIPNASVTVQDISGNTYYAYSNVQGFYQIYLPQGQSYTATANPLTNPALYIPCASDTAYLDTLNNNTDTINIGFQPILACPQLRVNISSALIRRCPGSSFYTIHYGNYGTVPAPNSYIDLVLDPLLQYQSATLSAQSLGNNTYRFQLGTLGNGQTGTLYVYCLLNCSASVGQVHCSQVHIYPDTLCNLTTPFIEILDSCLNDSILFRLSNAGSNMFTPQHYEIIEDDLMYRPSTPFQLNSGQSLDIVIPAAPNKTYLIRVQQHPSLPTSLAPHTAWSFVQNCNGLSSVMFNYLNQYYLNTAAYTQDVLCQANVGSYDPNIKIAYPEGYGSNHYVEACALPFQYDIHFQNTGNDTATNVMILDTLDASLDVTSIELQGASHPFTWSLLDNHILQFKFDNIMLPDSFVDEPASHGYVSFNVQQKPNLALGTRIENSAAIYFDANAPVITNTVFHTIAENFIQVLANQEVNLPNVQIKVYPNPFQNQATIELIGQDFEQIQVQIIDAMGKEVKTYQSSGTQVIIHKQDLPQGVYFYRLLADGQLLNTGKIIAQ